MACYAIGALGIAGFLLAERRAGDGALLTLRLFRNYGFAVGAGRSLVVNMGMFAGLVLLPLYLQLVKGYSPTAAGLLMLPQVAGTPLAYAEVVMFLIGAGSTLYAQTITLSMQNALPQADLGVATSSNTFFRQIGATAGAAVFLSITYSGAGRAITTAYASAAPSLRAVAARHPGQAGVLRLAASGSQSALNNTAFLAHLSPVLARPFRQGFTSALDVPFWVAALVMGVALVLALLIRELPLRTTVAAPSAPAEPVKQ